MRPFADGLTLEKGITATGDGGHQVRFPASLGFGVQAPGRC